MSIQLTESEKSRLLKTLQIKVQHFQKNATEEALDEICKIYIRLDASPAILEQLKKVLQVL